MLVARTNSALEVIKTGFEQYVADAARDYGLLYGMATAVMALLIGWFAEPGIRTRVIERGDRRGDAGLQQAQARPEPQRIERLLQVVSALLEMRPAFSVNGHNHCVGKCLRCFDGVVGVHGEMKWPARLRGTGKQHHDARPEATRDFGNAVIPDGVAGDVDRAGLAVFDRQHKADDIAGQRLNADGTVPRRRGGNLDRSAVRFRQRRRLPGHKPSACPPSLFAPMAVVNTRGALLRNSRPAWSRLSAC